MKINELEFSESNNQWLKLEKGDNRIRIVSEALPFAQYWVENKSYICLGENCGLCDTGAKKSKQFFLYVIDRKDKELKIAQVGVGIMKELKGLAISEDWAFESVPDFDITIRKEGEGFGSVKYFVIPNAKKDLSEEDKALLEGRDLDTELEVVLKEKTEYSKEDAVKVDSIPF